MNSDVWLSRDGDFRPGTELFRSDRTFQMWAYTVSHSQLLFSSTKDANGKRCETTIEILFKPIEAVRVQECYRGLVIACATEAEAERIGAGVSDYGYRAHSAQILVLSSQGVRGYVISPAFGWREGILPRTQPSLFNAVSIHHPVWQTAPLDGFNPGLDTASPAEIVQAFAEARDGHARPDRRTHVHVLVGGEPRGHHPRVLGVFLTEADAEQAAELLRPRGAHCWVEEVPMVL